MNNTKNKMNKITNSNIKKIILFNNKILEILMNIKNQMIKTTTNIKTIVLLINKILEILMIINNQIMFLKFMKVKNKMILFKRK